MHNCFNIVKLKIRKFYIYAIIDYAQGKGNVILINNSNGFPHNPLPLFVPKKGKGVVIYLTHTSSVTLKKQDILPPYFQRFVIFFGELIIRIVRPDYAIY